MAKLTNFKAKDMKDVIYYNKYIGEHFFDEDTMKFFGSKIESGLFKNNTFITSEDNYNRTKKLYTVRYYDPQTAKISTIGEFNGYDTRAEAKAVALGYKEGQDGNVQ